MTPMRLKQLASDPRMIPGVYNYCDRWCERCPFTARCLNFAMSEETLGDGPEARDMDNEKFWDALADNLKLAVDMIREDCEKRGIDFGEIAREASEQARIEAVQERGKKRKEHPLVSAAIAYMHRVDDWFKANKATFKAKGLELESAARMGLEDLAALEKTTRDLHDAIAVIKWYYMFISAKLFRAVRQDEMDDDPSTIEDAETRAAVTESRQSDSNGSAKAALIGMDRSLAAWARLREHLPEHGDWIIDLLVELDRVRRMAEGAFPEARTFVRPGFDDGTPQDPPEPKAARARKKRGA